MNESPVIHVDLKVLMTSYQVSVKKARSSIFTDIISRNNRNPQILFKTISTALSGPSSTDLDPDHAEKLASHFISKIENIQSQMSPDPRHLPTSNNNLASFTQFQTTNMLFTSLVFWSPTSHCVHWHLWMGLCWWSRDPGWGLRGTDRAPSLWNSLPLEIRRATSLSFVVKSF